MDSAQQKINLASKACDQVIADVYSAHAALGRRMSVNGYGVLHDRRELAANLREAQTLVVSALQKLDAIEFPTAQDYDKV